MCTIEDLSFYPKIENYYKKGFVKVIDVPKKTLIKGISGDGYAMHYILKGKVKVYSVSYSGRNFLLDDIGEGKFCGNLTKVLGHKFEPSLMAVTDCKLLYFPETVFNELLEDAEFAAYFYRSAADRVYHTYQKLLLGNLFSLKEIVAFHIYSNKGNRYFDLSLTELEEELVISRRSVFYIIKQLKNEGILSQNNKLYYISDMEKMERLIENIRVFKESLQ